MKCSIYHKDCSHTGELAYLLAKYPQPANHDQIHYIFVSEYTGEDRASTPIDVDQLGLEGDDLIWYIAKILATDIEAVLHLNVRTADILHRHPAWRIWCANYEERDQFKSDWLTLNEKLPSWPEYTESVTYEDARDILFNAVSQI